jgi:hypothetical protein
MAVLISGWVLQIGLFTGFLYLSWGPFEMLATFTTMFSVRNRPLELFWFRFVVVYFSCYCDDFVSDYHFIIHYILVHCSVLGEYCCDCRCG